MKYYVYFSAVSEDTCVSLEAIVHAPNPESALNTAWRDPQNLWVVEGTEDAASAPEDLSTVTFSVTDYESDDMPVLLQGNLLGHLSA